MLQVVASRLESAKGLAREIAFVLSLFVADGLMLFLVQFVANQGIVVEHFRARLTCVLRTKDSQSYPVYLAWAANGPPCSVQQDMRSGANCLATAPPQKWGHPTRAEWLLPNPPSWQLICGRDM